MAIIGILATVVVISYSGAQKKAKDARTTSDISNVQTALSLYYTDKGAYPSWTGTTGFEAPNGLQNADITAALTPTYIATLPKPTLFTFYEYATTPLYAGSGPTATAYGIAVYYENQIRGSVSASVSGTNFYQCQVGNGSTLFWSTYAPLCQ